MKNLGSDPKFDKDKWNKDNLRKLGLNERQIKAVIYVKEKGKITNKEYSDLAGIISRTSQRDLSDLCKKNIFEKVGITGRSTQYVLTRHKPDKRDTNAT